MRRVQSLLQRARDIGTGSVRQASQLREMFFRLVRLPAFQRGRNEYGALSWIFRFLYVRLLFGFC
jgi:hypothetical protein